MSSPTNTPKPDDPFHNLWIQLRECHQKELQELEEKVCRLKKDRRLDAESLQLFYTQNQKLKEQTKTLQDANSLLEDKLRTNECDRCAILQENLKNCRDNSERTITKLKYERNCLEDENRKLRTELQILKTCSEPQVALFPDHEDGIIPDSPILASSFPVAIKLKKRKYMDNSKHVDFVDEPSLKFSRSLFKEKDSSDASNIIKTTHMFVPNTCEIETALILEEEENENVVAETCGLELINTCHMKTPAAGKRYSSKSPLLSDVHLEPHRNSSPSTPNYSPDSTTGKSPSLLPCGKKLNDIESLNKEKITKKDNEPKGLEKSKRCDQLMKQTCKIISTQSFKEPPDSKFPTLNQTQSADSGSPAFKKPNIRPKEQAKRKENHIQVQNVSHKCAHPEDEMTHKVENMWSIDPALALSMYDSERGADEHNEELFDSDCTWISHSVLQAGCEKGIGDKANDSLDRMFEATAHEEYISYNSSQVASPPREEEQEEEHEQESPENSPRVQKMQHPTFPHVAVVRKKDERRKLKGTTCKECEVYYNYLPEEEKAKKLSECSRHRHRFLPSNTPEHFWDVGFPSTQTCIERGYIKEEKIPQSRLRRKQPLNALFSPKNSQQKS